LIDAAPDLPWKETTPEQVRLYVWEWPVRFTHWVLVVTIVSLSITGYYMHAPYVTARGHQAYVMGWMRFVHILSAFALTLAMAVRVVWFFLGNHWARLDQYIPLTKPRWRGFGNVVKYYAFLAWAPVSYIGHNPVAGLAYLVVYALVIIEIVTGFTMFSFIVGSPTLHFLFGWLPPLINIQYLRETHFLVMFAFWMFFIHHIYTAVLVAIEERSALMDSIFSGFKYVPEDELAHQLAETEGTEAAAREAAAVIALTKKRRP
jgi:Ni/Fe-hydrogenase 1 B-type cytochrome subunit